MTSPKTHELPQSATVASKSSLGKVATVQDTVPSQDRIRERAYELYEGRGCEPGHDQQDWFRAEREFLK